MPSHSRLIGIRRKCLNRPFVGICAGAHARAWRAAATTTSRPPRPRRRPPRTASRAETDDGAPRPPATETEPETDTEARGALAGGPARRRRRRGARPRRWRCSRARTAASPRAWCGCRAFISIRVELRSADGARVRPDVRGRDDQGRAAGSARCRPRSTGCGPARRSWARPTGARQPRCGSRRRPSPGPDWLASQASGTLRRPARREQERTAVSESATQRTEREDFQATSDPGAARVRRPRRGEPAQLRAALQPVGAPAVGDPGHRLHPGPHRLARAHPRGGALPAHVRALARSSSASRRWPRSSAR